MALPSGTLIDSRFKILGVIGEGGMATVYRAEQFGINRIVALKILHESVEASAAQRSRFLREGQVLAQMHHSAIVQFLHFGFADGHPYLAMELCGGDSLASVINEHHEVPWQMAVRVAALVAEALHYAHELGVIHRDLSPHNILVQEDIGDLNIKLIDFGLARISRDDCETTITCTGALVGSVLYMSPEQCRGDRACPKSDIYSLGCILYHMLSGQPPFDADTSIGVLYKHINENRPTLPALRLTKGSPRLATLLNGVVRWCMARSTRNRPAALQLASLLRLMERQQLDEVENLLADLAWSVDEKPNQRSTLVRKIVPAATCLLLVAVVVCGICWKAVSLNDELVAARPGLIGSNLQTKSLTRLVDELNSSKADAATMRQLLSNWRAARRLTAVSAESISAEAAQLAVEIGTANPALTSIVSDLGLEACGIAEPVDVYRVSILLSVKSKVATSLKGARDAEAVRVLLNPAKLSFRNHTDKQFLLASLLAYKIHIAVTSGESDAAGKMLCDYFYRYARQAGLGVINTMVYEDFVRFSYDAAAKGESVRFEQILSCALPWIASCDEASLPSGFLDRFDGIIGLAVGLKRPDLAERSWSILSTSRQEILENRMEVGLDAVFAYRKEYDRAVRNCLKRSAYLRPRNSVASLDLLRQAVHWQKYSKVSYPTPEVFHEMEKLFFSASIPQGQWIHRLDATACELKAAGRVDYATELLNGALSVPFCERFSDSSKNELRCLYSKITGRKWPG